MGGQSLSDFHAGKTIVKTRICISSDLDIRCPESRPDGLGRPILVHPHLHLTERYKGNS